LRFTPIRESATKPSLCGGHEKFGQLGNVKKASPNRKKSVMMTTPGLVKKNPTNWWKAGSTR